MSTPKTFSRSPLRPAQHPAHRYQAAREGKTGSAGQGGAQAGLGGSGAQQTAIQKGSPHHQLSRASHIEESEHFKKGSDPSEDLMVAFSLSPLTQRCHSFPEKKWNSISDIVVPNILMFSFQDSISGSGVCAFDYVYYENVGVRH